MTVPSYSRFMIQLLRYAEDGAEKVFSEAVNSLEDTMNISDEDRRIRLKHGQRLVVNRVGWALHELKRAGLLESTARGRFRMTDRGVEVLESGVENIDRKYLMRYKEYVEYLERSSSKDVKEEAEDENPYEEIDSIHRKLREALTQELLDLVKSMSDNAFEHLVVSLLLKMGYGSEAEDSGIVLGRSGDGGLDGVVKQDKLGLDRIYVQAKRWDTATVGDPVVTHFEGALRRKNATKGVIFTTSQFSGPAIENRKENVVLVDGRRLAELMIDHGLGVEEIGSFIIHQTDRSFFESET